MPSSPQLFTEDTALVINPHILIRYLVSSRFTSIKFSNMYLEAQKKKKVHLTAEKINFIMRQNSAFVDDLFIYPLLRTKNMIY